MRSWQPNFAVGRQILQLAAESPSSLQNSIFGQQNMKFGRRRSISAQKHTGEAILRRSTAILARRSKGEAILCKCTAVLARRSTRLALLGTAWQGFVTRNVPPSRFCRFGQRRGPGRRAQPPRYWLGPLSQPRARARSPRKPRPAQHERYSWSFTPPLVAPARGFSRPQP